MKRALRVVYTHEVAFVPGAGQIKTTITVAENPGMVMFYTEQGVRVSNKGQHYIIPLANVKNAIFAEPHLEDEDAPKPVVKPAPVSDKVSKPVAPSAPSQEDVKHEEDLAVAKAKFEADQKAKADADKPKVTPKVK